MLDQLIAHLPHLRDRFQKYLDRLEQLEVPAKTILLREGDISRRAFFVDKGCLRVWFNHHGRDITCQFMVEGQVVSIADSFRTGTPSSFTIEAIEPTSLRAVHRQDYDALMADLGQDNAFLHEMLNITFERQLHYMRELWSFIRDTPQERYQNLLRDRPQLVQRVPQHYIASYLGITPVHLSRIRNKMARENQQKPIS
ncbi:cAMP-binding domain of CRP or a regulatory subunit of cAMP-dependent protein kinases [Chitinophaga jiangningensis]|uniref:cAMP-binding domain of CRP or a regulatory subunit of cAMP-dependent protein kinases n=1 Tax=Chitinophaga jiangningensis TaxID=1419482 RepID=A0A1M7A8K3_9BACT|nr:Crp/Fnr family transcriptional regulator [Chitinophaga jiangningensis]SHL39043.1 cAMP-binding domain of CRP or a regulatory subunit of cAMP-dependent protein kinases [Chitinophaga jiangningensis]